ncbi:hypothetical protein LguiA_033304 [Lonicera macranthoides]
MLKSKRRRLPAPRACKKPLKNKQEKQEFNCQLIPNLPNHIVFDILSRLPVKTLFTCRFISKSWTTLLSNPEFAKLHLSRSPTSLLLKPYHFIYQNTILRGIRNSRRLHLVDLHTPDSPQNKLKFIPNINIPNIGFNLLNSCNGLLCLSDSKDSIYITNPILGEYIKLPNCGDNCEVVCAIGFSHMTNQYKVVRSLHKRFVDPISGLEKPSDDYYKAEVYTLGERTWRSVSGNGPFYMDNDSPNSFVNGALHWLGYPSKSGEFIHCFDFVSEQFRTISEPSDFGPLDEGFFSPDPIRVAVLRGHLSICNFNNCHLAIWMMKDYGVKESWSKDYVIQTMTYDWFCYRLDPIIIANAKVILLLMNNCSLQIYDLDGFLYDIPIYGIKSKFQAISHVPSFISLKDVAKGENVKVHISN